MLPDLNSRNEDSAPKAQQWNSECQTTKTRMLDAAKQILSHPDDIFRILNSICTDLGVLTPSISGQEEPHPAEMAILLLSTLAATLPPPKCVEMLPIFKPLLKPNLPSLPSFLSSPLWLLLPTLLTQHASSPSSEPLLSFTHTVIKLCLASSPPPPISNKPALNTALRLVKSHPDIAVRASADSCLSQLQHLPTGSAANVPPTAPTDLASPLARIAELERENAMLRDRLDREHFSTLRRTHHPNRRPTLFPQPDDDIASNEPFFDVLRQFADSHLPRNPRFVAYLWTEIHAVARIVANTIRTPVGENPYFIAEFTLSDRRLLKYAYVACEPEYLANIQTLSVPIKIKAVIDGCGVNPVLPHLTLLSFSVCSSDAAGEEYEAFLKDCDFFMDNRPPIVVPGQAFRSSEPVKGPSLKNPQDIPSERRQINTPTQTLSAGTYSYSSTVFTGLDFKLEGNGGNLSLSQLTFIPHVAAFLINAFGPSTTVDVSHCLVDGSSLSAPLETAALIYLHGVTVTLDHFTVCYCTFKNGAAVGVSSGGVTKFTMTNSEFSSLIRQLTGTVAVVSFPMEGTTLQFENVTVTDCCCLNQDYTTPTDPNAWETTAFGNGGVFHFKPRPGDLYGEVTLKSCKFVNYTVTNGSGAAVRAERLQSVLIEDCEIHNASSCGWRSQGAAIQIYQCTDTDILNFLMENCTVQEGSPQSYAGGIAFHQNTGRCVVKNCNLKKCSCQGSAAVQAVHNVDSVTLQHCLFESCSSSDFRMTIHLYGNKETTLSNCSFLQCGSPRGGTTTVLNIRGPDTNILSLSDILVVPNFDLNPTGHIHLLELFNTSHPTMTLSNCAFLSAPVHLLNDSVISTHPQIGFPTLRVTKAFSDQKDEGEDTLMCAHPHRMCQHLSHAVTLCRGTEGLDVAITVKLAAHPHSEDEVAVGNSRVDVRGEDGQEGATIVSSKGGQTLFSVGGGWLKLSLFTIALPPSTDAQTTIKSAGTLILTSLVLVKSSPSPTCSSPLLTTTLPLLPFDTPVPLIDVQDGGKLVVEAYTFSWEEEEVNTFARVEGVVEISDFAVENGRLLNSLLTGSGSLVLTPGTLTNLSPSVSASARNGDQTGSISAITLTVEDKDATLQSVSFTTCSSSGDGGAMSIKVTGTGTLRMETVSFKSCVAVGNGGGFALDFSEMASNPSFVLTGITFGETTGEEDESCSATHGNAFYVVGSTLQTRVNEAPFKTFKPALTPNVLFSDAQKMEFFGTDTNGTEGSLLPAVFSKSIHPPQVMHPAMTDPKRMMSLQTLLGHLSSTLLRSCAVSQIATWIISWLANDDFLCQMPSIACSSVQTALSHCVQQGSDGNPVLRLIEIETDVSETSSLVIDSRRIKLFSHSNQTLERTGSDSLLTVSTGSAELRDFCLLDSIPSSVFPVLVLSSTGSLSIHSVTFTFPTSPVNHNLIHSEQGLVTFSLINVTNAKLDSKSLIDTNGGDVVGDTASFDWIDSSSTAHTIDTRIVSSGTTTLTNSHFQDCHSGEGGGALKVIIVSGSLSIEKSSFERCSSSEDGGAVWIDASSTSNSFSIGMMFMTFGRNSNENKCGESKHGQDVFIVGGRLAKIVEVGRWRGTFEDAPKWTLVGSDSTSGRVLDLTDLLQGSLWRVSERGSDENGDGSLSSPFGTISRGLVEMMKSSESTGFLEVMGKVRIGKRMELLEEGEEKTMTLSGEGEGSGCVCGVEKDSEEEPAIKRRETRMIVIRFHTLSLKDLSIWLASGKGVVFEVVGKGKLLIASCRVGGEKNNQQEIKMTSHVDLNEISMVQVETEQGCVVCGEVRGELQMTRSSFVRCGGRYFGSVVRVRGVGSRIVIRECVFSDCWTRVRMDEVGMGWSGEEVRVGEMEGGRGRGGGCVLVEIEGAWKGKRGIADLSGSRFERCVLENTDSLESGKRCVGGSGFLIVGRGRGRAEGDLSNVVVSDCLCKNMDEGERGGVIGWAKSPIHVDRRGMKLSGCTVDSVEL
ncbi:hypothetical protein BLNAU_16484 [Blattamonas nauphoetae]|uniref:Right handed beta helix domain-containing protein n=1 Tax=Blattamonas nauphoetae TaxID=2049346 RepID=A0ABQ9XBH0_9EUKA|nr:hypothetical protein BLNAU_16484 [Blattamonas nauphoetae]